MQKLYATLIACALLHHTVMLHSAEEKNEGFNLLSQVSFQKREH